MELFSTNDYTLEVGVSREEDNTPAYHVINKESKVIEYEDYMLPRAIDSMMQIQERLDEAMVAFNKPKPVKFGVIEPTSIN